MNLVLTPRPFYSFLSSLSHSVASPRSGSPFIVLQHVRTLSQLPTGLRKVEIQDAEKLRHALIHGGEKLDAFSVLDVRTHGELLLKYSCDWLGDHKVESVDDPRLAKVVVKPRSTSGVSEIMKYCFSNNLALSIRGGNTGLVGGSIPLHGELVLSLERMKRILSVDQNSGIATAEAGVVLEDLNCELEKYGLMSPYDLGAKGSCQIGGNVATNAGGLRFLRYGSLHGSCLGLEAVLPDKKGSILDLLRQLKKDNTGLDLKQLFIGGEGALGVITKVAIQCVPLPKARNICLLKVESFEEVLQLLRGSRDVLGENLSAFEFFDFECVNLLRSHYPELLRNIPGGGEKGESERGRAEGGPFYALLETSGSVEDHLIEKVSLLIESLGDLGKDAVMSSSISQFSNIWKVRETITLALNEDGKSLFKFDVSVPTEKMYTLVLKVREEVQRGQLGKGIKRCVGYGHVGDGNLHLNITSEKAEPISTRHKLEALVYATVQELSGSISAEHGIGSHKIHKLYYSKPEKAVEIMQKIKKIFDEKGILNPGKTIPSCSESTK